MVEADCAMFGMINTRLIRKFRSQKQPKFANYLKVPPPEVHGRQK